jgi:hypothetical protein
MNEKDQALEQVKQVFEDGVATINGRDYCFLKMRHEQRLKVFAFYSSIASQLQTGSFEFLDSDKFRDVSKVIFNSITYDGCLLSKLPEHWEEFGEDYVTLVATALGVISYPFFRGQITSSQSQSGESLNDTLRKPM